LGLNIACKVKENMQIRHITKKGNSEPHRSMGVRVGPKFLNPG
jgi:hypothetical protein